MRGWSWSWNGGGIFPRTSWLTLFFFFFWLQPKRRIGVAIGDLVLDLSVISTHALFRGPLLADKSHVFHSVCLPDLSFRQVVTHLVFLSSLLFSSLALSERFHGSG